MKITIENGKETVINLSGQLDTLTSVDLEKEIAPILQGEAQTVVLDGAELTYISSAGLRLLLTPVSYTHLDVYKRQCMYCWYFHSANAFPVNFCSLNFLIIGS